MASANLPNSTFKIFLFIVFLSLIVMPKILTSQTNSNQGLKLSDTAIKNYLIGLKSDNRGIKMSCLYFAGKYKIDGVSSELLKEIQNSNEEELCRMAIWSLYQIGDDECCEQLESVIENSSSEKIKEFCNYLNDIRKYEIALSIK